MSGPSKQPHNAGQTVIVQQISPMPVSDVDWGPITITENWGRLFIRWNGQEVIALMGHYPKLVEAIQHFIQPADPLSDPRVKALVDAARELRRSVCGPTGFAEAVRHDSGQAYPWPSLDAAELALDAALRAIGGEA